jgi:hypothetical protein
MTATDSLGYTRWTAKVPVQFLVPPQKFMHMAAETGRRAGLDEDWFPTTIHAAIYESLISATTPDTSGMVVRPASKIGQEDVFVTEIYLLLLSDPDRIQDLYGEHLPAGFDATFENLMLGLLNVQAPPVDFDYEIEDSFLPSLPLSAHEKIEEIAAAQRCQFKGDMPATMFVA